MTEFHAIALVALAGAVAVVAIRVGLGAAGATDEQIASAWVVSMVITALVGGFVFSHYNPPPNDRR